MGLRGKRSALAELGLALMLCGAGLSIRFAAAAQSAPAIATTAVTDTLYRADGTAAQGSVLISWPAFTNADGSSVPAGSTSVTIAANGALSVALVPNAGSTPIGSFYTVVYHLDDGSVTREYWVVPVSASPVTVASIRNTVLPTSVAMQTVSKSYVDTAILAAVTGHPLSTQPYVSKTGDTMSGPLVLPGDPTAAQQASDKHYVDAQIAAATGGVGQKVSLLPQATQVVVQPVGTALDVNNLNGKEYASQYVSGTGNNGIANATASPDCSTGCDVVAEQTYNSSEAAHPTSWNGQTHLDDRRGGASNESFFDPLNGSGQDTARSINLFSTTSTAAEHIRTGSGNIFSTGMVIDSNALTGGSNIFPNLIQGTVPYFKTTYSALSLTGNNNTPGQHVLVPERQNCFGVGDCLLGGEFILSSGGLRDDADEGAHPFDIQLAEDNRLFTGTCASGCAPGATLLQLTPTGGGTQGEGRYLLDTNPAKVITSGVLTGGAPSSGLLPSATFSGTSFPVSVLLETAQGIPTQVNVIAPGTVTIAIVASGAPAGFSTGTAALPANSGVACLADQDLSDGRPTNFETAAYTVVDATHLQLTLNRPHASGATIGVGGLCGYGLEQKVDTVGNLRQVFPVVGSTSPTSLIYAGGQSPLVGTQLLQSGFANISGLIASIARNNGVVTVTLSGALPADVNGSTLTIANVADASYNGSFAVTTTGSNTLTYTEAGANSTSSGGTVSLLTGGFALYPMAEVLGVYNTQTKAIDGQVTLAANTVTWATGDTVEQPHYFQQAISADTQYLTQYLPRPERHQSAGIQYQGTNGPGLRGWVISNYAAASSYFGNGGTHAVPDNGLEVDGAWLHALDMQAGDQAAIALHCNSHGCNRWNSGYNLFQMDSSAGQDTIGYTPTTSNLNFLLRGTTYQFTPQSFIAGTINVTTLNAGTITGTLAGAVTPSSLPVFGASGAAHNVGAVPDPGSAGGATRFLREDGTWSNVPVPSNIDQFAGDCLGMFNFTDTGAQPAMVDTCNGYAGVFPTSNAPIRNGIGYEFMVGQQADFPAQMNNFGTLLMVVNFPVFTTGTNGADSAHTYANGFLLGPNSTNTDTGFEWLMRSVTNGPGMYGTDITSFKSGSKGYSPAADIFTGTHVLGVSCAAGAGPKLYLDGLLVLDASAQSNATYGCDNALASGDYQIGRTTNAADNNSLNYFHGTVYAARFTSAASVLTDAQVAENTALLRSEVERRGVEFTGHPYIAPTPAYIAAGDSITCGFGLTGCGAGTASSLAYPFKLTGLTKTYRPLDFGQSGALVQSQIATVPWIYGPQSKSAFGSSIASLFEGTNNFGTGSNTASDTWDLNVAWVKQEASYGARTMLISMIARTSGGTCCDTQKNAFAGYMRAGWKSAGANAFVDLSADPYMGVDGGANNTTYFQSDMVHPNATGQARMALAVSCGINSLDGSTVEQPNPTAITAATYTATCSDGGLLADASANAVNITLNSALWQTGRIISVCNVTRTGSNAVTLTAPTDAPFNNVAGSTTLTVAAGSCTKLMSTFNGVTTAPGEYWRSF